MTDPLVAFPFTSSGLKRGGVQYRRREMCAVAIPGDGLAEEVLVKVCAGAVMLWEFHCSTVESHRTRIP